MPETIAASIDGQMTDSQTIHVAHILSGSHIWGVENYVHNLLSSSNASALTPLVICTKESAISEKFRKSNFDVQIIPIQGYFDINALQSLMQIFRAKNIDLVHVHLGLDSFVGAFAAKLANIPSIMSVHFDHPNWINYGVLKKSIWTELQKVKNDSIAHFLPITKNVGIELTKREAVPETKITVVHPGIPLFEVNRNRDSSVREQLGCSENETIVIGIGRLQPEKNFACVIKAIAKINPSIPLKVWIVGDGAEKQMLQQLIDQLQLSDKVKLLGYRSDVPKLLEAADIFVLASKAEPFGMSAVEAMIARLPVVATEGPGLGTIVSEGETGLLVPPDDSAALASAIEKLVTDPKLRSQFAESGRRRAEELFTSEGMAQKIVRIYRDVIDRSSH